MIAAARFAGFAGSNRAGGGGGHACLSLVADVFCHVEVSATS